MLRSKSLLACTLVLAACGGSDPLEISTASLSAAVLGEAYSANLAATGGSGEGYAWSITSGALPAGLSLRASGTPGTQIQGTPEAPGTSTFELTVTDSEGQTAQRSLTLVVSPTGAALSITTAELEQAVVGEPYSAQIRAQGGKGTGYQWQVTQGILPDGLSLAATGSPSTLVSGTANAAGIFVFTVEVSDGAESTTRSLTLTVQEAPNTLSIETTSLAAGQVGLVYLAEVLAAEGTGQGYAWRLSSGALPAGLSLAASGTPRTEITGTPEAAGSFTFEVEVSDSGGHTASRRLSLEVAPADLVIVTSTVPDGSANAPYSATLVGAGGSQQGYQWTVVAGTLPQGLILEPAGTPSARITGTPAAFGSFDLTVELEDGAGAKAQAALTFLIHPALTIESLALPRARQGQAYQASLAALDGAGQGHAWTLTQGALPVGLQLSGLDLATLTLSGTPAEFGDFPLTLAVTDAHGGVGSRSLVLSVDPVAVQILTTTTAAGAANEPYSTRIRTTNGTGQGYAWSTIGLPPGLSIDATGAPDTRVTGSPSAFGTFTATVTVQDTNADVASAVLVFEIAPPAVFIVTTALPDATFGVPYAEPVVAELGSQSNYQWSVSQGSLPFGLGLDSVGTPASLLAGNPQQEGPFSFSVTVVDANGRTDARAFTLNVVRNLSIETRMMPVPELGAAYTAPLEAAGGTPPYTWSVAAGALPAGLSLLPVGAGTGVVGTPTVVAPQRFTVEVQDAAGGTVQRSFLLSPRDLQRWAATVGDTVVDNDGLVVIADITGAPTNYLTVNPNASGFGDASTGTGDAAFAPNNSAVAHIGDFITDTVSELFMADLSTGGPVGPTLLSAPMTVGGDVVDFLWSPASTQLVYAADQRVDEQFELFVVDLVGGVPGVPRLVSPPMIAAGDVSTKDFWWSPDGRWVVMLADATQDGDLELYVADVSGPGIVSAVRVHGALPVGSDVDDNVAFVPDGSGLVFLADLSGVDDHELYYVDLRGPVPGTPVRLNTALPAGGDVSFDGYTLSPDGRRLAFVADQAIDNQQELYAVNLNLSVPSAPLRLHPDLLDPAMDVLSAGWAPDSTRVVYAGDLAIEGDTELFIVDVTGLLPGPPSRVSAPLVGVGRDVVTGSATDFGWSADGAWLAYRADSVVDDSADLFLARLSGPVSTSTVVRVNADLLPGADVDGFLFAPNSQRIVYRADQNVVGQTELFVVDLSQSLIGPAQAVNGPMPTGGDVDLGAEQLQWSRDSARIFYRSDEFIDNNFEAWVCDVSGATPGPPLLINPSLPTGGDVSFFILQR